MKIMTRQEMRRYDRYCKKHPNLYQQWAFLDKLKKERQKHEKSVRQARALSKRSSSSQYI